MADKDDEFRQLIIDYKETFCSEAGKKVLEHLKQLSLFNVSAVPRDKDGRIDPYEVIRQEGKRSVIIHIETMINKDPNEKKGIKHE